MIFVVFIFIVALWWAVVNERRGNYDKATFIYVAIALYWWMLGSIPMQESNITIIFASCTVLILAIAAAVKEYQGDKTKAYEYIKLTGFALALVFALKMYFIISDPDVYLPEELRQELENSPE